jgi:short-subunit dehydrogenase
MYLAGMGGYSALKRALANISLTAREELKEDNVVVSVVYPYITVTDFEKNTIKAEPSGDWQEEEQESANLPPPDTAEYVAQKIVEGIESGEAEIFPHDWMKNLPRRES